MNVKNLQSFKPDGTLSLTKQISSPDNPIQGKSKIFDLHLPPVDNYC